MTAFASSLLTNIQGSVASGTTNSPNPVKAGAAFNTTQPTVTNGQLVDLQATNRGGLIVATGADPFAVAGTVASGSADSGNPVKVGGVYHLAAQSFADGQRGDFQLTSDGSLKTYGRQLTPTLDTVSVQQAAGTQLTALSWLQDGFGNSVGSFSPGTQQVQALNVCTTNYKTLAFQTSTATTATYTSTDLDVSRFRELQIMLTAGTPTGTTPTLQAALDLKGQDGVYYTIWQSSQLTAAGSGVAHFGAGMGTGLPSSLPITQSNGSWSVSLGQYIRFRVVIGGTTPSWPLSFSVVAKM